MRDGVVYREFGNVGIPGSDLKEQGRRLKEKFIVLASPVLGDGTADELLGRVRSLEECERLSELAQRCQ